MRSKELAALRDKLHAARGPEYWRGLEELAATPEFQAGLRQEFADGADLPPEGVDRRRFLQVMGASLALAGVSSCTRQPIESIVPYVKQPEEIVPGRPLYFATAHVQEGFATGVLVENHLGRPTKLEGNPDHPASRGATDHIAQASILDLYDPDRAQVVKHIDRIRTWEAFDAALANALASQEGLDGDGLRILTPTTTSATFAALMQRVRRRFPKMRWVQWDPVGLDAAREGWLIATGKRVSVRYDFSVAKIVLSLDADFLTRGPGHLAYARDFMAARRVDHLNDETEMSRLYVVESEPTNTGAVADHRLALSATQVTGFAMAAAFEAGVRGSSRLPDFAHGEYAAWLNALGSDLRSHKGESIVLAGPSAPAAVHALAMAINGTLANVGRTVHMTDAIEVEPRNQVSAMRQLVTDMRNGRVDVLLVLGGNPVYDAPRDLDFAGAFDNVGLRVHLSLHEDETSEFSHWHLPQSHDLEAWGDARAFDGTASILQPLIAPLYRSRSTIELLAAVAGESQPVGYDLVRSVWRDRQRRVDFESWWRRALHDGWIEAPAPEPVRATYQDESIVQLCGQIRQEVANDPIHDEDLEVQFRSDANVRGGNLANNGWLQEIPRPWTRLTWDNAVLVSPATAKRLDVESEDVVELRVQDTRIRGPVWVTPGHPDHAVTVHLGYGRRRAGRVGTGVGFDAYPLRMSTRLGSSRHLQFRKTGERQRLACTQTHHSMEGRHLFREATLREFRKHPDFAHEGVHHFGADMTLYPPDHEYKGNAWGMAVDLSACTGCNACVAACNVENNIPVVGMEQIMAGREMHWIRIDRYFEGSVAAPRVAQQPVMCQHCENAPCEVVCPVGATMHSDEGLNEMIYNRCVGTRYCSNNCPYKVRRFNFFMYSDLDTEVLKMMRNPDVTVRTRGVMEKCTYCVQRINLARIQAKQEGRGIADGEIVTACQQVCPTEAIVFGDINDPNSKVSKLQHLHRNYTILDEVNTRPRTSYLARVFNPNPHVPRGETSQHGHSGA